MQIITTAIIRGGVGKTTTTLSLAQAAAHKGKRVLVIDLDPQANLTMSLGASTSDLTSYEVLHGTAAADAIEHTTQNIDIIPASANLATEISYKGSAMRLQGAINVIKRKYDYIFIDTPPHMCELTYNALQACTGLIIPLEVDKSSVQGLHRIADIADHIKQSNTKMKILGVIITRYDGRSSLNSYLREVIEKECDSMHIRYIGTIRAGVAIKEAAAFERSLYSYAPKSKPAQDYMNAFEIIDHTNKKK